MMTPSTASQTSTGATVHPIGFVTAIDPASRRITVRTDAGPEILVLVDETTTFMRVAAGVMNLSNAARIPVSDVRIGDRILARGPVDVDHKRVRARSVFVKETPHEG
jgi:hypothetical protein